MTKALRLVSIAPTANAGIQQWLDYELALMVETRLDQRIEPNNLNSKRRTTLAAQALYPGERLDRPLHRLHTQPYWLQCGVEIVGIIATQTLADPPNPAGIQSLYVLPTWRRRGFAKAALAELSQRLFARGFTRLRLDVEWINQQALRWYLGQGWWVLHWKHDIALVQEHVPLAYRVVFEADKATFWINEDGNHQVVACAQRAGTALILDDLTGQASALVQQMRSHIFSTFAVYLAINAWPLIRSAQAWAKRARWSDCGLPEGLADRIQHWQAIAKQQGFRIDTPQISGFVC